MTNPQCCISWRIRWVELGGIPVAAESWASEISPSQSASATRSCRAFMEL